MERQHGDERRAATDAAKVLAENAAGGPRSIDARLQALDREWDVERLLAAGAGGAVLLDLALRSRSRGRLGRATRWLPILAAVFLVQQALVRTSLPARLLRRRGMRSTTEIAQERYALKALRGDFKELPPFVEGRALRSAERLLELVRR